MAVKKIKVLGTPKIMAKLTLRGSMNSKTQRYSSSTLKTITKEIKRSNLDSYP
jgi:hypothetical protein